MCPSDNDDLERERWYELFRRHPPRLLADLHSAIEVPPAVKPWGEIVRTLLVGVPLEVADRFEAEHSLCAKCGQDTVNCDRILVSLYPEHENGLSIGLSAWLHAECFEACEVLDEPTPVPW